MKNIKDMHQLWQTVILKPLKLGECIFHFWKLPIFIFLVLGFQGQSYIRNAWKAWPKLGRLVHKTGFVDSDMQTTTAVKLKEETNMHFYLKDMQYCSDLKKSVHIF